MTDLDHSVTLPCSFNIGNVPLAPNLRDSSASLAALLAGEGDLHAVRAGERPMSPARLGSAAGLFRVLRLKHPSTANHSVRVSLGCSAFASFLGLDETTREYLEIAALLHDIGKLALPDQVLNKPERLNDAELALMDCHLQLAVHIVEPFCDKSEIVDAIAFAGHWFDGSRPGDALVHGEKIPIASRILAIQNAFDSMTSDFVYREAFSTERAIEELLEHAGRQFDPKLTEAFVRFYRTPDVSLTRPLVRRWVEQSSEQADSLWTLATPIFQVTSDTLSIFQQHLLQSMHDAVVFFDKDGRIVVWNEAAKALTGLSKESVHHKQWYPHIVDMRDMLGNETELETCPVRHCLENKAETTQRMMLTNRSSGDYVAVNVHMMPVGDATGAYHGAIMILHDVTSEFSLETHVQVLQNRATRDALTGVHNRAEFDRSHAELVTKHAESGAPLSLVICDIDFFKSINDTHGHQAGDEALISFAKLIDRHCRGDDIVARYGGEEFVMLCPGCDLQGAAVKAEGIRKDLASTRQSALKDAVMTASFGVAELEAERDDANAMLKRADAALYEAKKAGRNQVAHEPNRLGEVESTKSTWSNWLRLKSSKQNNTLAQARLRCSVPSELVLDKIQSFIETHQAQVGTAFDGHKLDFSLTDWTPTQRRQHDRPVALAIQLVLQDDHELGMGTLIQVTVAYPGSRERRLDDAAERARMFVGELRDYVAAEDA